MQTVFFDFQLRMDIRRTAVEGWAVISIRITRNFDGASDIGHFHHIGQHFFAIFHADMLDQNRRISRQSEPFRSDLDPPNITLLGHELISINIGRRCETARDITRQIDLLAVLVAVVRLDLFHRGLGR